MSADPIPRELIDIVEFVPDKSSLLACALAATSFVNASQRQLFHMVLIRTIPEYERLAGILSQSPHLGGYVRLLVLLTWDIPEEWAPLDLILSNMTLVEKLVIQGRAESRSHIQRNPSLIDFLYQETLHKPTPDPDRDALLVACAPTLQVLEIEFSHAFALPPLPSLWQLELWTHEDRAFNVTVIPATVSLALQATPCLEILKVAVRERTGYNPFGYGTLPHTQVPEWTALDARLLELQTEERGKDSLGNENVKLGDVHFSLRYFGDAPQRYEAFVSDVKSRLPRALGAEFLTFSHLSLLSVGHLFALSWFWK
ncbi:hypothetical protein C8R45DRAFT_943168 [Mycena sanguinolenta]|nr:hypothetical protein C8R45DRAFT_943168 [Mycena sanguinolenta]